jgi:protein phosphatase 2C family protein 2/3
MDEDKIGRDETKSLRFGLASLQGRRPEMEDFYNIIPKYRLKKGKASLFAVYDGHGGAGVAELCSKIIPKRIKKYSHGKSSKSIGKSIQKAFLRLDEDLLRGKFEDQNDRGGSTAVVTIITKQVIVVGSVGDSRVVACVDGLARAMTEDHKPENEKEAKRVERAGLSVSSDSEGVTRVRGLNMSRSIGDLELKQNYNLPSTKQAVIAKPSIQVERTANVSFIVLACDGVFDVMTNEDVIEYIRRKLAVDPNRDLDDVALSLLKQCYHRGTGDNMTLIIVQFKR